MRPMTYRYLGTRVPQPAALADKPIVIETADLVSLCFDHRGMQSCMLRADPDALTLGYTRTMMGFLLFHAKPSHIGMIGLGGGSLVKYCYRRLPDARITAVEISPEVIALRERFHIQPDDGRLTVLCDDGARFVSVTDEQLDAILLDGFDAAGFPQALGSDTFYADCRRRLSHGGVLAINFLSDDPHLGRYLSGLRRAFGATSVALAPAEDSANNIIAFAWNSDATLPSLETSIERAHRLADQYGVDILGTAMRLEIGASYDWERFGRPSAG